MSRSIHTIWVPEGRSPEQVWEAIKRREPVGSQEPEAPHDQVRFGGRFDGWEGDGYWTNVEVEGLVTQGPWVAGGRLVAWNPAAGEGGLG